MATKAPKVAADQAQNVSIEDRIAFDPFDLLAAALEPRFGSIYEYNFNGGKPGFDIQLWTDEIKTAIRDYLLHDLPEDVARRLFMIGASDESGRESQVDELIANCSPLEVSLSVRKAAVLAVPTLDMIVGDVNFWESEEHLLDVAGWLDARPEEGLSKSLAMASGHRELLPVMVTPSNGKPYGRDPEPFELVRALMPRELIAAWRYVVGPAPSDLTDTEWALLAPFLSQDGKVQRMTNRRLANARRALDGVWFRYEYNVTWNDVPKRYGSFGVIMARCYRYKTSGVFGRALKSLVGNPDAMRLVRWLRSAAGDVSSRSR